MSVSGGFIAKDDLRDVVRCDARGGRSTTQSLETAREFDAAAILVGIHLLEPPSSRVNAARLNRLVNLPERLDFEIRARASQPGRISGVDPLASFERFVGDSVEDRGVFEAAALLLEGIHNCVLELGRPDGRLATFALLGSLAFAGGRGGRL